MLKRQSNAILYRIASFDSQTLMSAYTDPLFVRSLHTRSIANRFDGDFVNRIKPIEIYNNNSSSKGGKLNGLTLRSCFDSHKKADQKARALAQHRRLLRGLGSGSREECVGGGTTDLADGRGAYLRSNTTRFQGNDRIVVAVDIDEGMHAPFVL